MSHAAGSDARPTLVCLHFLGGSAHSWDQVAIGLDGIRYVGLDLPGFGEAAGASGYSVQAMADAVERQVEGIDAPWVLAGHSMGAKVAAVLARRAEDGEPALSGLAGIVLVAGSPPCREPIEEAKRQEMLGWFGDAAQSESQATHYIGQNTAASLDRPALSRAVGDVLRMNRAAWLAWLQGGSLEDWSDRVGVLRLPALIVAGGKDGALGEAAQRDLTAPHYATHRMVTLPDAGHALPLERPGMVAQLICEHVRCVGPH